MSITLTSIYSKDIVGNADSNLTIQYLPNPWNMNLEAKFFIRLYQIDFNNIEIKNCPHVTFSQEFKVDRMFKNQPKKHKM